MKSWFASIRGQSVGPITEEDIVNRVKLGELHSSDLVWCEGMPSWVPLLSSELSKNLGEAAHQSAPPMGHLPPPLQLINGGVSFHEPYREAPVAELVHALERSSLPEKLMFGCQSIAVVFCVIASLVCINNSLVGSGIGIFLMGHAFMLIRGLIEKSTELTRRNQPNPNAESSRDVRSA